MMLLFLTLWLSGSDGQCLYPIHLWPQSIALESLVELTNTPLPCAQIIDAGPSQSGYLGQTFALSGRLLAKPPKGHDGLVWQQLSGPQVTLAKPHALETSFEPKTQGNYRFALQISGPGWIAASLVSILVTAENVPASRVQVRQIASDLGLPVQIVPMPEQPEKLLLVEQRGKIKIVEQDKLLETLFLDLDPDPNNPMLWDCFECGVLGLTFDPNYATNGLFYLSYTGKVLPAEDPTNWDQFEVTRIFVYQHDPQVPGSPFQRKLLLSIPQPFRNHHGGQMAFGPDGMFYISLGDSSPCGDPDNHAQDMTLLLGKVLRFETHGFADLTVPADNPFVDEPNIRPEIWASGFRNPWRWSFDPQTGDIFWGDVGQETWEEVNWQPFGMGGENYGWRIKEGLECYAPRDVCGDLPVCPQPGLSDPIFAYPHSSSRCAVIGGFVYRGPYFQHLEGHYIFGDFCNRNLMMLQNDSSNWVFRELTIAPQGEDLNGGLLTLTSNALGDIYFATFNQLFRVVSLEIDP